VVKHLTMQSVFKGPVYVVRDNIDTDQIIPAQYLNLVPTIAEEYEKLGSFAMAGLPESLYATRFVKEGKLDSDYPILVGGRNFGCGSSREHAPWALYDFGFRAVIAPSYADIFNNNCYKNGLLPIVLPESQVDRLFADALAFPGFKLVIDLERQIVSTTDGGTVFAFDVEPFRKHCMLNGLDDIGLTLQHKEAITAFETKRLTEHPWL
jgi:3-isopropylmalate/(R)-2-methylmalate dehydratase small subunit